MSFAKNERACVDRLAKLFEGGSTRITPHVLFEGIKADTSQQNALCESLEHRGLVKLLHQLGQLLPIQIEILPTVIEARDREQSENKLEQLKTRFLSRWSCAIVVLVFVVVGAVIAVVATLLNIYGVNLKDLLVF